MVEPPPLQVHRAGRRGGDALQERTGLLLRLPAAQSTHTAPSHAVPGGGLRRPLRSSHSRRVLICVSNSAMATDLLTLNTNLL